jgi:hypothetical protein
LPLAKKATRAPDTGARSTSEYTETVIVYVTGAHFASAGRGTDKSSAELRR